MKKLYTILKIIFVSLILFGQIHCGGGGGGSDTDTSGGDTGGVETNPTIVDPIFVRTGVSSSTVIDQQYRSTVYIGRYLYQEDDSGYDLSFNPSRNFLKDLEFEE